MSTIITGIGQGASGIGQSTSGTSQGASGTSQGASGTSQAASGTTGTAGQTRARMPTTSGLGTDFNTFLTLLTTQLRNQDPTNAMDVNKMTEQLVQFSGVEQQVQTNGNLQQLIALQQGNTLTSASNLLGRVIEVESDRLSLQGGQAALRLPAAGAAQSAVVQIGDATGRIVREARIPLGTTPANWSWDGRDAQGRALADGAYRFTVQGTDAGGGPVTLRGNVMARATGVERGANGVTLQFGALSLGYDAMRSVQP